MDERIKDDLVIGYVEEECLSAKSRKTEVYVFESQEVLPENLFSEGIESDDVGLVGNPLIDILLDNIPDNILEKNGNVNFHLGVIFTQVLKYDFGLDIPEQVLLSKKWAQALVLCKIGYCMPEFTDEQFYKWYLSYFSERERDLLGEDFICSNSLDDIKRAIEDIVSEVAVDMLEIYEGKVS